MKVYLTLNTLLTDRELPGAAELLHKASRLGFRPLPPLDYYIRLAKGLHEIRRDYGLTSTNDDYKHCGNHPDSDLERLD